MSRRDFFQLFCMFYLRLINRKCAEEKKHPYLTLYQNWKRTPVFFELAVSASYHNVYNVYFTYKVHWMCVSWVCWIRAPWEVLPEVFSIISMHDHYWILSRFWKIRNIQSSWWGGWMVCKWHWGKGKGYAWKCWLSKTQERALKITFSSLFLFGFPTRWLLLKTSTMSW